MLGAAVYVADMAWIWNRPAAAALIHPLAWALLYAAGVALKSKKKKKKDALNMSFYSLMVCSFC